jgi:hypothetical protein
LRDPGPDSLSFATIVAGLEDSAGIGLLSK